MPAPAHPRRPAGVNRTDQAEWTGVIGRLRNAPDAVTGTTGRTGAMGVIRR